MAVFGGITEAYVVNNAQSKLAVLRRALEDCENFYQWLSAYSLSDLEAAPLSMAAADAQDIMSAFADAHGMYVLYTGGTPAAQVPYNFSGSQRAVIGPLT